MRAFCAALAAAGTVLVASALGLPVSSTHIAVGGVFGVGLIREYWRNNRIPSRAVQAASPFVEVPSLNETPLKAVKKYEKRQRRRLVRRQHLLSIGAAWIITVPATAAVSALIYLGLNSAIAP
jgi:PiT family inorganic phosphate transporter